MITHAHIPQYNIKIGHGGYCYDCGVELSADGQYGRQDYVEHATRGTLTLHSLYLLLWANFGTLCMALLTQPEAEETIHGSIISKQLSVRHYCVSQLRTVWMHMRNNLGLLDEEQSFLVMRCTKRLYEVYHQHLLYFPTGNYTVFTQWDTAIDSLELLPHLRTCWTKWSLLLNTSCG